MKLSERITRWRESRENFTKSDLARAVGVSSAAVAQWEGGDTEPTVENVEKIATAIGVSMQVFWGEPPAAVNHAGPKKKAKAS